MTTRRALLAAAAASPLIPLPALPAAAGTGPTDANPNDANPHDRRILALLPLIASAAAAHRAVLVQLGRAEAAFQRRRCQSPKLPERGPGESAAALCARHAAAIDDWSAADEALRQETGVTEAEALEDAALDRLGDLLDELRELEPETMAGLLAKLTAAGDDPEMPAAICRDLERLAELDKTSG